MNRIINFGVNFENSGETPYFQVLPEKRIRFDIEGFKGNSSLLRNIIHDVLNKEERIDTTFISGYIINNKRYPERLGINKFFQIKNWKETIVEDKDLQSSVIYVSVKNIDESSVYNYCKALSHGYRQSYISFYNDSFLVYANNDVLDIISHNKDYVKLLKEKYNRYINRYYEDIDM